MVKHQINLAILFVFPLITLAGCFSIDHSFSTKVEKDVMEVYYKYTNMIETAELANNYPTVYAKTLSNKVEKELSPVTNQSLGWAVYASYMPKIYIKKIYVGEINNQEVCVTLIGKSHEETPKYVNLLFVQDESVWKIADFTGKLFFEGSEPSFPIQPTCPTSMDS